MTWEILTGLITFGGSLVSVMTLVVKVNRTLVSLEEAVRQLREFMTGQNRRNDDFRRTIHDHDIRIARLESHHKD